MKFTFFAHRDMGFNETLKQRVIEAIEKNLSKGQNEFYFGGYSGFDSGCARFIGEARKINEKIKTYYVTPYITENEKARLDLLRYYDLYDEFIYPSLESVPPKYAISKRNKYMVEQADVVIVCLTHSWGGAYKAYKYAKRKNKIVVNVSGVEIE